MGNKLPLLLLVATVLSTSIASSLAYTWKGPGSGGSGPQCYQMCWSMCGSQGQSLQQRMMCQDRCAESCADPMCQQRCSLHDPMSADWFQCVSSCQPQQYGGGDGGMGIFDELETGSKGGHAGSGQSSWEQCHQRCQSMCGDQGMQCHSRCMQSCAQSDTMCQMCRSMCKGQGMECHQMCQPMCGGEGHFIEMVESGRKGSHGCSGKSKEQTQVSWRYMGPLPYGGQMGGSRRMVGFFLEK